MKKRIPTIQKYITIFLVCLFAEMMNAQDFRQFYWGDSITKVKSTEKDGIYVELAETSPNTLSYYGIKVADKNWTMIYFFTKENKLIAGSYLKEFSDSDFSDMKRLLTKKYDEPVSENNWLSGNTMIMLMHSGDNIMIGYVDKDKIEEFLSIFESSNEEDLEGL